MYETDNLLRGWSTVYNLRCKSLPHFAFVNNNTTPTIVYWRQRNVAKCVALLNAMVFRSAAYCSVLCAESSFSFKALHVLYMYGNATELPRALYMEETCNLPLYSRSVACKGHDELSLVPIQFPRQKRICSAYPIRCRRCTGVAITREQCIQTN